MTSEEQTAPARGRCPGCGLTAPETGDDPPAEHVASAACYRLYGQLLARDYSDAGYYRAAHQMVVDAYAAQHAGGTSRREVQSVALCLMTLCLFVEAGVDPAQGPRLHQQLVANRPSSCGCRRRCQRSGSRSRTSSRRTTSTSTSSSFAAGPARFGRPGHLTTPRSDSGTSKPCAEAGIPVRPTAHP